jgi:hypothetical protein
LLTLQGVSVLRVFVLTAGVGLLVLPQLASALPPGASGPSRPSQGAAILLAQAQPAPAESHPALDWAKARLAEINAAITALEDKSRTLADDARKRADDALRQLRATRDAYSARIDAFVADGRQKTATDLADARAALDARWTAFEDDLGGYFGTAKSDVAARKAVFQARVTAEEAYWRQSIAGLKASAETVAAEHRPAVDAKIAALQADADAGGEKLAALQQDAGDAWSKLQDGLTDARQAFDKDYDAAKAAIERARQ